MLVSPIFSERRGAMFPDSFTSSPLRFDLRADSAA
jgi:hypothetical protein